MKHEINLWKTIIIIVGDILNNFTSNIEKYHSKSCKYINLNNNLKKELFILSMWKLILGYNSGNYTKPQTCIKTIVRACNGSY